MTISDRLLEMARADAATIHSTIAGAGPEVRVEMTVEQVNNLAHLISMLCDRVDSAPEATGDHDGFGDSRYWVPLPEYERLKTKVERMRAESAMDRFRFS